MRRGNMQPWPKNPPEFREIMLKSFSLLEKIAETCLSSLAKSAGIDYNRFASLACEPEIIPDHST